MHGSIVGRTADDVAYDATDPDAQAWVLATLIDSLWEVERRFVGRLTETDRDRSVVETRLLAQSFNIDLDECPGRRSASVRCWRATCCRPLCGSGWSCRRPGPTRWPGFWLGSVAAGGPFLGCPAR